MRSASSQFFALVLSVGAIACSASGDRRERRDNSDSGGDSGGSSGGGKATGGSGGLGSGGAPTGGSATGGSASGGKGTGGMGTGGSIAGSGNTGGGGAGAGGVSGNNTGGNAVGGATAGAGNTGGGGAGRGGAGGGNTGGNATGGSTSGGANPGGNAAGGSSGTGGSSGGTGGGDPTEEPDCEAAMPSGGQMRSGNGTGGEGNLAWEIWSNTGQGELTTYDVPAFVATWNNSGGYLGRLGFEWGGFGDDPVPHDQRGTITAQFVSRRTGSAGGYSYVGMYGWTNNPCVEWYIVDDSYNNMPINPGNTTNEGEVEIDGGTYIMYSRPTTGTGGSRCSGVSDWIQYYSVRRTARACGVISLSEHFLAWESLGMTMSGELLEAKILVEVGGGVGNVQLPIANVTVQ